MLITEVPKMCQIGLETVTSGIGFCLKRMNEGCTFIYNAVIGTVVDLSEGVFTGIAAILGIGGAGFGGASGIGLLIQRVISMCESVAEMFVSLCRI